MLCNARWHYVIALVFVAMVSVSSADEGDVAKRPATKLETFSAKTGAVVVKGYTTVGAVKGSGSVTVDAKEFKSPSGSLTQQGIAITVKESGRLERQNISYIDFEEIESLLSGIEYILKVDKSATLLENFEATYRTKGELALTTFNGGSGRISAAVSSGSIGKTTAYISLEDLQKLKVFVAEARDILAKVR